MSSASPKLTRRNFLKAGFVGLSAVAVSYQIKPYLAQARGRVGVYHANSYQTDLVDIIKRGIREYSNLQVKDKTIVLKPNLVEYFEARKVNTNPLMIVSAAEAFRSLGAREVIVAEGPGHRRDTEILLEQSGLSEHLKSNKLRFVDLNLDDTAPVRLPFNYTGLKEIHFPKTILGADLVVSMPKLKTHKWVGVTLSLKNMFGVVPGVAYGWPKNVLHWHGLENSIVDINTAIRPGFAIIDGIEGMEGLGPLAGETVYSNVVILGDNPTAVDSTATRLMGLRPEKISYLQMMGDAGQPVLSGKIEQIGETLASSRQNFRVLPKFDYLKA
jgi:uncharacterized protein (DUF362 family)